MLESQRADAITEVTQHRRAEAVAMQATAEMEARLELQMDEARAKGEAAVAEANRMYHGVELAWDEMFDVPSGTGLASEARELAETLHILEDHLKAERASAERQDALVQLQKSEREILESEVSMLRDVHDDAASELTAFMHTSEARILALKERLAHLTHGATAAEHDHRRRVAHTRQACEGKRESLVRSYQETKGALRAVEKQLGKEESKSRKTLSRS